MNFVKKLIITCLSLGIIIISSMNTSFAAKAVGVKKTKATGLKKTAAQAAAAMCPRCHKMFNRANLVKHQQGTRCRNNLLLRTTAELSTANAQLDQLLTPTPYKERLVKCLMCYRMVFRDDFKSHYESAQCIAAMAGAAVSAAPSSLPVPSIEAVSAALPCTTVATKAVREEPGARLVECPMCGKIVREKNLKDHYWNTQCIALARVAAEIEETEDNDDLYEALQTAITNNNHEMVDDLFQEAQQAGILEIALEVAHEIGTIADLLMREIVAYYKDLMFIINLLFAVNSAASTAVPVDIQPTNTKKSF